MQKLPIALVLAAGDSRRYKEAGYTELKPFLKITDLEAHTCTMVEHVINTIPSNWEVRLAVSTHREELRHLGVKTIIIKETRGQADTVYQALQTFYRGTPVVVMDCDMRLQERDIRYIGGLLEFYEVAVAVTRTFDPNASTVSTVPPEADIHP